MFTTPPITCLIEFSHSTRIFYSGDQVCGKITLHASKKTQLEGISINLVGLESVQWTEQSKEIAVSYDDSTTYETKAYNIEYKGNKEHLIATLQLSEAICLEPGEFVVDFRIALPEQLLPTCKQANGCLDYQLQVVLQRKFKWQKLFQKRVILRNRLDLNHVATQLNAPFTITCCALADNEITFRIPHTGFVPGQLLPFSIQMTRLLYKSKIVINLCQKIAYKSQLPMPKRKEITKVLDYHIATSDEFNQLQLPLPLDISTTSGGHSLMSISYYLEFLVINENLQMAHRSLIPLIIGSVALVGSENTQIYENPTSLHYYDNLATSKYELQNQERAFNNKLINFDQITYQTLKCAQYNQQRFKSDFKRLFTTIYDKIAI